jgi:hypothetical protein
MARVSYHHLPTLGMRGAEPPSMVKRALGARLHMRSGEVGREQTKGETPSASVSPEGAAAAPSAPTKPKKSLHTRRPPINIGGVA